MKCSPVRSAAHWWTPPCGSAARAAWDYQPVFDASQQYVRNSKTLDELEDAARFPRVARE